jgi:hypothetical protein
VIRIVGLQRNESPEAEFVLLQNQGSMKTPLRGHVLMSEDTIALGDRDRAHVFRDDAVIPPGMYVLLTTGCGESRWAKSRDGSLVFYCYMNRSETVWSDAATPMHVLATQHTFAERQIDTFVHR